MWGKPGGKKRPWMNLRERKRESKRESSNITDPQISFWFLVELEFGSKCLLKAPFLLPSIAAELLELDDDRLWATWYPSSSSPLEVFVPPRASPRGLTNSRYVWWTMGRHLLCLASPCRMKTTCYSNRSICKLCPFTLMVNLTHRTLLRPLYYFLIVD